ncbi:MAG: hypothetical protein ABI835_09935, partial [Chloroflexota bacterium]
AAALPMFYAPLSFYDVPPASPETAILYESSTGNLGLTSGNEYLPRWSMQRPLDVKPDDYAAFEWRVDLDERVLPADVTFERIACERGATCYNIDAPQAFTLVFHQLYFPGWLVTIDGTPADTAPLGEAGLLSVGFPAGGAHRLLIRYGGTTVQSVGAAATLVGILVFAGLTVTAKRPRRREWKSQEQDVRALAFRIVIVISGFILVNGLYLSPQTSVFRYASDPANPPADTRVQYRFGDMLELLGYDLSPQQARAGDTVTVRLYWRALQPLTQPLRASVHVTALNGQADWGGSESLSVGELSQQAWTTDRYALDEYRFKLDDDAPPYLAELRVSVFRRDNQYLEADDGSAAVVIGTLPLVGDQLVFDNASLTSGRAVFGEQIALLGAGVSRPDDANVCVNLRWQALHNDLADYTVMLHVFDTAGTRLVIQDAPPLHGLYPTSQWQSGQTLDDAHCFSLPDRAAILSVALYSTADGVRLPVTDGGGYLVVDNILQVALPA